MGEEQETVWDKSEHAGKKWNKKIWCDFKAIFKNTSWSGLLWITGVCYVFFFYLFSLSNVKDTVRRQVFRDGLYVLKGEMCWH